MRRRPIALWAWSLALVLLLAQGFGVAHRVAHGGAAGHGQASALAPADADGHHEPGGAECRLIDQLALADAAASGAAATAALLPPALQAPPVPRQRLAAGAAAAYLARAPPRG